MRIGLVGLDGIGLDAGIGCWMLDVALSRENQRQRPKSPPFSRVVDSLVASHHPNTHKPIP